MVIRQEKHQAFLRKAGLFFMDMALVLAAVLGAMAFRFIPHVPQVQVEYMLQSLEWVVPCYAIALICSGTYSVLWSYASIRDTLRIVLPLLAAMIMTIILNTAFGGGLSRMVLALIGILAICLCCLVRLTWRMRSAATGGKREGLSASDKPVLIVGAGDGANYAIQLCRRDALGKPIALVDDDPHKQNLHIHNIPVKGYLTDIPSLIEAYQVKEVIVAILSLRGEKLNAVVAAANAAECQVRIISQLHGNGAAPGGERIGLRKLNIADFLCRDEVRLNTDKINGYLQNKRVLVTGGGGSIGSELCRQIMRFSPKELVVFDIYENCAYELQCALRQEYGPDAPVRVLIGSIQDVARVNEVMDDCDPDVVFHAAAHKHVPLMEDCPAEAVKNNVQGTRNVLQCASGHNVSHFVTLSSDKAVNPSNVMGATKRITEMLIQLYAKTTDMKCTAVRFGNVLGSHGSVIPLFEAQIQRGGPVTVTHPDMERYFMTIPEAAQLVLQAGGMAQSGAIYMLDMGQPVKIMDLAEKLIRFYGFTPNVDMEIKVTGLRPGEKLSEELLTEAEASALTQTEHKKIAMAPPIPLQWSVFAAQLEDLIRAAQHNDDTVVDMLTRIVPTYRPRRLKMAV